MSWEGVICVAGVIAFVLVMLWVLLHGDGHDNIRG